MVVLINTAKVIQKKELHGHYTNQHITITYITYKNDGYIFRLMSAILKPIPGIQFRIVARKAFQG